MFRIHAIFTYPMGFERILHTGIGDLSEDNFGPPQYSEEDLVAASLQQVGMRRFRDVDPNPLFEYGSGANF